MRYVIKGLHCSHMHVHVLTQEANHIEKLPAALAVALAIIVFPQPGGPYNITPVNIEILIFDFLTVDPQERSNWRSGVRSAMHAASQLPERGPTDVDDAPASAC